MYFYHGFALGAGSTIKNQDFTEAASALTLTGGFSASDSKFNKFNITFDAHSEVSGIAEERNGFYYWVTKASAVIKNLRILNRITADAIDCHLFSEFRGGDSEAGTIVRVEFRNLQVDERALRIDTSEELSEDYPTYSSMQAAFENGYSRPRVLDCLVGREMTEKAATTEDLRVALEGYREQSALPQLKQRVLCSVVKKVSGGGFDTLGSVVAIPNLGNLYLGEVLVWPWMRCLTAFRIELRSGGNICGGIVGANGTKYP